MPRDHIGTAPAQSAEAFCSKPEQPRRASDGARRHVAGYHRSLGNAHSGGQGGGHASATEDLRVSGIMDRLIKVGDQLPSFALPNAYGQDVRSSDLLAQGPLVLTFFRGAR
jgi:hypothetical protein